MFEGIWDFITGFLLPMLTVSTLVCTPIVGLTYLASAKACEARAVSFAKSDFDFFAGCIVEYDGKMVPLQMLRINVNKKE